MSPSGPQNQAPMPKIEFPDTDSQMVAHYLFQKRVGLSNMIERELGISFVRTGLKEAEVIEQVSFRGDPQSRNFRGHAESERMTKKMFSELFAESGGGSHLHKQRIIHLASAIQKEEQNMMTQKAEIAHSNSQSSLSYKFNPLTVAQGALWTAMSLYDLVFAEGPASTGKTHVAIARGAIDLVDGKYERMYLARPARGSGKDSAALPGDQKTKLAPYYIPLYDELAAVLGTKKRDALIKDGTIDLAPVETIQGRTLKNSFIVLDEAQNTQDDQMELCLSRIGQGSKMVVCGSNQQVVHADGRHPPLTGLRHALNVLEGKEGIGVVHFTSKDIVGRHGIVKTIVQAFEEAAEHRLRTESSNVRALSTLGTGARFSSLKR